MPGAFSSAHLKTSPFLVTTDECRPEQDKKLTEPGIAFGLAVIRSAIASWGLRCDLQSPNCHNRDVILLPEALSCVNNFGRGLH
jgi:hypothetical protein